MMHTTRYYLAAVLASVLTLGCDGPELPPAPTGPTEPTTGVLEVKVSTTGNAIDLDVDGYSVRVDNAVRGTVGVNSTVEYTYKTGAYTVRLEGLSPNCSFFGPSERTMTVSAGQRTVAAFDVTCAASFTQFAGAIAYVQGADSDAEIYVIKSGDADPLRLTTQTGWDGDPAWSPDGARIAFASDRDGDREIYVMDADGTNPVRLTTTPGLDFRPAWSPDGTRIAFVSGRDRHTQIYLMNADGTSLSRLTAYADYQYAPDWSPDGSRIAFESSNGTFDSSNGIWTVKVDGTDARQLTSNPREDWQPAWSPDGTMIVFARVSYYTADIYVVKADGTGLSRVTSGIPYVVSDPTWSPDGRSVAFGVEAPDDCFSHSCNRYILVVQATGSFDTLLLRTGVPSYNPAWRR